MRTFYCRNCDLVLKPGEYRTKLHLGERGVGLSILDRLVDDYCAACGHEVDEVVPCTRCKAALPMAGADECKACCAELDAEIEAMVNIARVV